MRYINNHSDTTTRDSPLSSRPRLLPAWPREPQQWPPEENIWNTFIQYSNPLSQSIWINICFLSLLLVHLIGATGQSLHVQALCHCLGAKRFIPDKSFSTKKIWLIFHEVIPHLLSPRAVHLLSCLLGERVQSSKNWSPQPLHCIYLHHDRLVIGPILCVLPLVQKN